MGITALPENCPPFATSPDGVQDGIRLPHVIGTYLHGALENKAVLEEILGHSLPEVRAPKGRGI